MESTGGTTSWDLIEGAAQGDPQARAVFAERYESLIREYLGKRWRVSPLRGELDDAMQEIFLECFRQGGVLERADPERGGGFRAFLYGVVRNVALRFEDRRRRDLGRRTDEIPSERVVVSDSSIAAGMDREWADAIVGEAVRRMEVFAREKGEEAMRRVELLRLRFRDGLPIREIAPLWDVELIPLHLEDAKARREFKTALKDVLYPGAKVPDDLLRREIAELGRLLHGS